jgi:hypothetical protein
MLVGCNKDKIVTDIDEQIDPPIEIGLIDIKGVIKSTNGVLLPDVIVSVHQNGKKIGSILSDQRGTYSTKSLPIDPLIPVTLEYQKQGLIVTYKRFDADNLPTKIYNPLLGKIGNDISVSFENLVLSSPSDTNLIKIWGYTKLANGTPVRGVQCYAGWEYRLYNPNFLGMKTGVSTYTNDDGYFELLVPKNKLIYLSTFYQKYPDAFLMECQLAFQNLDENPLKKFGFNEIGPFNDDTEVLIRKDINVDIIMLNIKGRALRCDGSPVKNGYLEGYIYSYQGAISIGYRSYIDSNYIFGTNGEFQFYIEACKQPGKEYGIGAVVKENYFEGQIQVPNIDHPEDLGEAKLCKDNTDYPDEFSLKLGNDPVINYLNGGDFPLSGKENIQAGFHNYNGNLEESVYLTIKNIAIGIQPITSMEMWRSKKISEGLYEVYEKPFIAQPSDVVLTITKIEDPYVSGTISGMVNTTQGAKNLEVIFKIYNK